LSLNLPIWPIHSLCLVMLQLSPILEALSIVISLSTQCGGSELTPAPNLNR